MSYQPVPALGKAWLTPFFDMLLAVIGLGGSFKERVLEKALIQPHEHLLDVGCGTATLLLAAKSRYPTLSSIGIDSDEHVLALARKKIQKKGLEVEVMQAHAEDLAILCILFLFSELASASGMRSAKMMRFPKGSLTVNS